MLLAGVIPPTGHSGEGKTQPSMMLVVVPPTGCLGKGKTPPLMMLVVVPPTGCCGKKKTPPPMMLAVVPPTGHCGKGKTMALTLQRIQVKVPSTWMSKSDACDKLAHVPATMPLASKQRKRGCTS
jgi:hypothetical protein